MSQDMTALVSKYRKSGLSQIEFCKRGKIPLTTFQYHIYKKNRSSKQSPPGPQFISITDTAQRSLPCTITIVRGAFTPNQITEIIRGGEQP